MFIQPIVKNQPLFYRTGVSFLLRMPITRSATRTSANQEDARSASTKAAVPKRKSETEEPKNSKKKKINEPVQHEVAATPLPPPPLAVQSVTPLVPAVLTFSFEEAKKHLIAVDHRFEDLFDKLQCKPFEHLERVQPFRALTTSILGQQISWLAARSIIHKFTRLYNSSLPEKVTDYEERSNPESFFPTADQVANTEPALLRSAGLSARKVEYIQDLANRFADGRLSTNKLLEANDEDLAKMLIEIKGIGRWTVDMFAIFSLRRPNILPVGDLGVQRGLARWFLTLHSPAHRYSISPEKIKQQKKEKTSPVMANDDSLPVDGDTLEPLGGRAEAPPEESTALLPPLFTPSIKKTLNKPTSGKAPLPEGLSVSILKSRLEGKQKVKGAFLTPKEMADLTESWQPYRSIGVYYMWSLAEGE